VAGLTAALEAGAVDAVTFTSSSTVRNFVELLGRRATARLLANGRPAVACIGPVTAETARDLGLRVDVMPAAYTAPALAAALAQHFGKDVA
jgi:uroporphyrinogen-III synthase